MTIEIDIACEIHIEKNSYWNFLYEKENHLGNVLAVISDQWKTNCLEAGSPGEYTYTFLNYAATVVQATDYSAFGAPLPGRTYTLSASFKSRFSFNGEMLEDEIAGEGMTYDLGERFYDGRIGRMISLDPLEKKYVWQSPYAYFKNCPITTIDFKGQGGVYDAEASGETNSLTSKAETASKSKQGPTAMEAAAMSDDVYNTKKGKYTNGASPSEGLNGWKLSGKDFGIRLTDEQSGFNSAVYERSSKNEDGNITTEYCYVTQGTDVESKKDWSENGKQATGQFSDQYHTSVGNALILNKSLKSNESLSFAGHSLGGGMATANAYATGKPAIVFNPAALHKNSFSLYKLNKSALITAFVVEGEIVSNTQNSAMKLGVPLKPIRNVVTLSATYLKLPYIILPATKAMEEGVNTVLRGYYHTMGAVISKMKKAGY